MKTIQAPAASGMATSVRPDPTERMDDERLQQYFLKGVSRTFALTIPLLPGQLAFAVSNAYLLCRTIDTIEDEPALPLAAKRRFCERWVRVVAGEEDPDAFAAELLPGLTGATKPMERELIRHSRRIVAITHGLEDTPRRAIERCLATMSEGMIHFQERKRSSGLPRLADLNRYCYVVAGVVGELLTDLFCHFAPHNAENYDKLMALATSFGQGLQMTNILKDAWDDRRRGACWLPRDLFLQEGYDLDNLWDEGNDPGFQAGLKRLIGIAHAHLHNALRYTLLLSPKDKGIRRFCLLALGLAILTIRKINHSHQYFHGEEVKISRRSVRYTYLATRFGAAQDWILKALFRRAGSGVPLADLNAYGATS